MGGRLTLITRYGAGKVEEMLPTHIEAVKATGVPVVWQCDAVHGNGVVAKSNKMKTRHMDDIVAEIVHCIAQEMRKRSRRHPCGGDRAGDRHRVPRWKRRHHRGHAASQLRDLLRPAP